VIALKDCAGCRDNFYNGRVNFGGGTRCWSAKDGKMIKRLPVYVHQPPPYDAKRAVRKPSCYHEQGVVWVSPDALDSRGYWKR
jgi:hypothetical protein